jgi:hypothetical protein
MHQLLRVNKILTQDKCILFIDASDNKTLIAVKLPTGTVSDCRMTPPFLGTIPCMYCNTRDNKHDETKHISRTLSNVLKTVSSPREACAVIASGTSQHIYEKAKEAQLDTAIEIAKKSVAPSPYAQAVSRIQAFLDRGGKPWMVRHKAPGSIIIGLASSERDSILSLLNILSNRLDNASSINNLLWMAKKNAGYSVPYHSIINRLEKSIVLEELGVEIECVRRELQSITPG